MSATKTYTFKENGVTGPDLSEHLSATSVSYLISRTEEVQTHMNTCSVKTIYSASYEMETTAPFFWSTLSASFSCECGEYIEENISSTGSMDEIGKGLSD